MKIGWINRVARQIKACSARGHDDTYSDEICKSSVFWSCSCVCACRVRINCTNRNLSWQGIANFLWGPKRLEGGWFVSLACWCQVRLVQLWPGTGPCWIWVSRALARESIKRCGLRAVYFNFSLLTYNYLSGLAMVLSRGPDHDGQYQSSCSLLQILRWMNWFCENNILALLSCHSSAGSNRKVHTGGCQELQSCSRDMPWRFWSLKLQSPRKRPLHFALTTVTSADSSKHWLRVGQLLSCLAAPASELLVLSGASTGPRTRRRCGGNWAQADAGGRAGGQWSCQVRQKAGGTAGRQGASVPACVGLLQHVEAGLGCGLRPSGWVTQIRHSLGEILKFAHNRPAGLARMARWPCERKGGWRCGVRLGGREGRI